MAQQSDPEKNVGSEEPNSGSSQENGRERSESQSRNLGVNTGANRNRSSSRATSRADRDDMASLHRSTSHNAAPIDPMYRHQHEWTMYEALADRDEVNLDDDERMRLEELHERFDYAKAKPGAKKGGAAGGNAVIGKPSSPIAKFKPGLPLAEEHEHEQEHGEVDLGLGKPI